MHLSEGNEIINDRDQKLIVQTLLNSKEPAVQLKTYLRLFDHDYETKEVKKITKDLKQSSKAIRNLLSYLPKNESTKLMYAYKKWQGVHWILTDLADIGYPPGDHFLIPSRNYELQWLLSEKHWGRKKTIQGRKRFCASQEGNGLYSILKLGLDDGRANLLAERLIKYQWDDGGWNCDTKPNAVNSSYHESIIPLRALNAFVKVTNDYKGRKAVECAAKVFLKRKLYKKLRNDEIIDQNWIKLHYPPYWHYDILIGLKVLTEVGKIKDPRCNDALDLLESKKLPDGGFPADGKYYRTSGKYNFSPVNWGGTSKRELNVWVTIDALYVLKEAGRIDIEN
ncbi:MAG: hypothetical protein ACFFCQ_16445 [Promethearchaeota archaeon]